MPVYFDGDLGTLAVSPGECKCGQPWYDTGCAAPGCLGQWCPDCGGGCDIEVAPDDGTCASAIDAESDQEAGERINRERAAFGLRPIDAEER
jgi:hypothetical protein